MSIRLSSLVRQTRGLMNTGQKYLLDVIADHANEEGVCWPSVETLHLTIERSRSVTFEYLDWLEANGFITRNKTGTGRNWYQVHEEPLRQLQLPVQKLDPSRIRTGPESGKTGPDSGLPPSRIRTSIKQPSSNHQEPPPREGSQGHGDQWKTLDKRQQQLVSSYQPIPSSLRLDVFCSYVDHRAAKRRQLSGPAWMLVRRDLLAMEAAGADLNESLQLTIRRGLVDPVPADAQKPATPRANDDLSGTVYGANDLSKLPAHLRPAADVHD